MKTDLSKIKVGEKVWTIQDGWINVQCILRTKYGYPIGVKSNIWYTMDGRANVRDKHPSAFLECPFNDNESIQIDTLVWYKDYLESSWNVGYYSHFQNEKHFVFLGSKNSNQERASIGWNIITTENPFQSKIISKDLVEDDKLIKTATKKVRVYGELEVKKLMKEAFLKGFWKKDVVDAGRDGIEEDAEVNKIFLKHKKKN